MSSSILGYIFPYDTLSLLRLTRSSPGNNDVPLYARFGHFFIICFDYATLMFLGSLLHDVACDSLEAKSRLPNLATKVRGLGL